MGKFILGYIMPDGNELIQFDTKEQADNYAEEWVEVEAETLEEAKGKYEESFLKWKADNELNLNAMKQRKRKYYLLVTGFIGDVPNMYDTEQFQTKQDAVDHFIVNYKKRKKGDGYDERWNNTPLVIMHVETTETIVLDARDNIAKPAKK